MDKSCSFPCAGISHGDRAAGAGLMLAAPAANTKKPRGLQQGSLAFGVRVPHFGDDAGWRRQGLMKFRLSEAVQGSVTITSLAGGLLLSLHTQLPAGRGMQGEPDQAKLSI